MRQGLLGSVVFLGYFGLTGKTALQISNSILEQLKFAGLDIMLCRSKGYDNAAIQYAGVNGGVQALKK